MVINTVIVLCVAALLRWVLLNDAVTDVKTENYDKAKQKQLSESTTGGIDDVMPWQT